MEAGRSLLGHKTYNRARELNEGQELPWGRVDTLSENEVEVLREWFSKILETRKIQESKS
jgi:hypothetical protein